MKRLLGALPIVIGHRGAPGYLPDHTLVGYELAVRQGADFIEPDLVMTKDGVAIVRHENELSGTTDVAERFPDRWTSKIVDGEPVDGWFSEDFTLAEIKTLRARQPLPFRDLAHDGVHEVPTFDEVVALAVTMSAETGRTIGIYPETKHPSYFAGLGLPIEPVLLRALDGQGWTRPKAPVFVQSFEPANLRALRKDTRVRLVQLVGAPDERPAADPEAPTYGEMLTDDGLAAVARYADGIGVHKSSIVPVVDGVAGEPTGLVERAHARGLLVHVYTFRDEPAYLPNGVSPDAELRLFLGLGVDGVFADFPDRAVAARAGLAPPLAP